MKESELLDAAADRLERTGWRQHAYGASDGPNCMVGAIVFSYKEGTDRVAGAKAASAATNRCASLVPVAPTTWNDRPGRTKDEVTTVLRKAAKLARLEEEGIA